MQVPAVGIYESLANCPPALEQLGRAFMMAKHPTCNLSRISNTGYEQVGDIVLQAMRGQNFPTIDLADTTPLTSHRVTQLTFSFVAEVLLHSSPVPEEVQNAIFQQISKPAMGPAMAGSNSSYTTEERIKRLVTELTNANIIAPLIPLSVDAMARKQLDLFRSQVAEYHPQSYPGNPVGHVMAQYLLLTELDCSKEFSKDFNVLCNKLGELCKNAHSSDRQDLPRLFQEFQMAQMVIALKIQQYTQQPQSAK